MQLRPPGLRIILSHHSVIPRPQSAVIYPTIKWHECSSRNSRQLPDFLLKKIVVLQAKVCKSDSTCCWCHSICYSHLLVLLSVSPTVHSKLGKRRLLCGIVIDEKRQWILYVRCDGMEYFYVTSSSGIESNIYPPLDGSKHTEFTDLARTESSYTNQPAALWHWLRNKKLSVLNELIRSFN